MKTTFSMDDLKKLIEMSRERISVRLPYEQPGYSIYKYNESEIIESVVNKIVK